MTTTSELALERQTLKNFRWNAFANGLDLVFFTLGMSLVSRETVMPVLVSQLTDSRLAIGLIPAIFSLSFYLPQLLMANFAERLRYKKPFVMIIAGPGERGAYLLIGLSILFFAESAPGLTLALFFLFLAIGAACSGTVTPAWYDMIAKVIPVHRRGIWSGVSNSLGALIAIAGALLVGHILETTSYPRNFAWIFLLAFGAWIVSYIGLALNREPPSMVVKEHIPLYRYLRQLPAILRRDQNYRRFLLSRTTIQFGAMAMGFFTVYTAILVASQAVMNLVWGMVADRIGHKIVLAAEAFIMALAVLNALMAASPLQFSLTYMLLGAYWGADNVSAFNIIIEFCQAEDRPTYIGLTNTLLAPLLALGPVIGGWLAISTGYPGLFLAALVVSITGGVLMAVWVREPREMAQAGRLQTLD
jgi:MFS family permease